jgi:DNA-binding NtrC family response regulator
MTEQTSPQANHDSFRILLVEDDDLVRVTVRDALEETGYKVLECAEGRNALKLIENNEIDLLLSDIRLPEVDGITLFRKLKQTQPLAAAVLMTAYGELDDAVTVLREGAHDYITKPFEIDALILRLGRILQEVDFSKQAESVSSKPDDGGRILPREINGSSMIVRRLLDRIDACAQSEVNVLITGETGTGKELCARMIHLKGQRKDHPFVAVNCAAVPENLLESEFFGHEKGAFTGADRSRDGRFKAADGGTLFLDEVGALPKAQQAKLLRAIETGSFEPVGTSDPVQVNVRVIAATNEDLDRAVAEGRFREDLFFRLNVVGIRMPRLVERRSDIPILVRDFLEEIAERIGSPSPAIDPRAIAALVTYDYPGNIRELLHALEHAVALCRGDTIMLHHLPHRFTVPRATNPDLGDTREPDLPEASSDPEPLCVAVKRFEREYIQRVVDRVDGHRGNAAKVLGISRKSLWQKLLPEDD